MNETTVQPTKEERYESPEIQDIAPVSVVKGDANDSNNDTGL